ncbi:TATA box-binding protein-associated factor RNA polymerase I subunit B-like isoform X1 [Clavelina lepadiformis]|uniref:TATA box-binding protein-associated factor RNA polymerase I subunit B-like isoform X1 n=1 Tax=Clavelina lepadiformis TaxID=159417 RepID=UPI0040423A33
MPVCHVCDGQDFELLNGLYFCQVCSTQSQDVVEEDFENVAEVSVGKILDNKNKGRKSNRLYNEANRGKPWYSVEGLQVLLKAQVEALIQLGCSEELREVVKQIWFKYVHKSGIAVIDPSIKPVNTPRKGSMTFRDEYLSGALGGTCIKKDLFPSITSKFIKLKLPTYTKGGKRRRTSSSSDDEAEFSGRIARKRKIKEPKELEDKPWRSDEEWFSLASNDSSDSDSNLSTQSAPVKRYQRPDRRRPCKRRDLPKIIEERKQLHNLTLSKLISILYIGVQWCKELITLGDLIKWIEQGYIPYIDWFHHLLPHMKLTNFDITSTQKPIPSYQMLVRQTTLLIDYVEMPTMPEADIHHLVLRYITQLNLPRSLASLVHGLMTLNGFKYARKKKVGLLVQMYQPDVVAMSLIVVIMKLFLGLDDEREWALDESAQECHAFGHDCKPFLWKTWSGYHLRRWQKVRNNPNNIFQGNDPEAIEDLHSYTEHWENIILSAAEAGKEIAGGQISSISKKSSAETKRWVFDKLCEMQGTADEWERRKLSRDEQFVYTNTEDSMAQFCVQHVLHSVRSNDWDYNWYSDSYTRVENCIKKTRGSAFYDFGRDCLAHGEMNFHQSYDFILALASELTCATKGVIHTTVQELERDLISPHWSPKNRQIYSSTSWTSSEHARKWLN